MTDDLAPFESPKLLIEGIKLSIPQFETACNTFTQGSTHEVIDHIDPKTGEKVRKLRFQQRMPGQLRVDASRILNDLRHSLDQAVCDGAIALGRRDAKGIYFPFGKSTTDLSEEVKNRLKKVDAEFVTFIRGFNSHYGGDDELYSLGSICGPNKHQRILRISLGNSAVQISPGTNGFYLEGGGSIGGGKWNELRNELEIMRFNKSAIVQGDLNVAPVLQIVIGAGETPLSGSAVAAFRSLTSKVESIVLGLEAETARILRSRVP